MKLLFFPAVTKLTFFQPFTAFFIACYKSSALPVLAKFCFVSKEIWLPSKILEVMRIYTLCFVMFVIVRAPFCLKEKDIEVEIRMLREQMMNEANFYILYWVCERTIVSVLALLYFVREAVAKLRLVFVLMIQSFNAVMRSSAFVSFGTLLCVGEFT